MNIYCDGSGYNGEQSAYAVVTDNGYTKHEVYQEDYTSNVMEWKAMIAALLLASPGDTIYSDSQLVVNQLVGKWDVNADHLKPLAENGKALYRAKKVLVKWVRREQNLAGRYLDEVQQGRERL